MTEKKRRTPWIDWWEEPEPVDLRVEYIGEAPIFPGECFVRFTVNGEMYTGFFPDRYVSRKKKVLSAAIYGDTEDGWFVRIPEETFQGGPQVVVPHAEKDALIIRHPENSGK